MIGAMEGKKKAWRSGPKMLKNVALKLVKLLKYGKIF